MNAESRIILIGEEPPRLWSLSEMLNSYAWEFFLISQFVHATREGLGAPTASVPPILAGGTTGSSNGGGALASYQPNALTFMMSGSEWLSEKEKEDVPRTLNLVKASCQRIGILNVSNEIDRIVSLSGYAKRNEVHIHLSHLTERIIDELETAVFLHVASGRAKYYDKMDLFGEDVGKKFPKLSEDISSAGSCFSLGQYTACVFHLMRAMEYCVQRFGKKLRIALDTRNSSWYDIMEQVNAQIRALPGGRKASRAQNLKKQRFGLAAGRLDHVRIVWRNDVMHPKETYNEAQALEVLTSVEAFLKSIVGLI